MTYHLFFNLILLTVISKHECNVKRAYPLWKYRSDKMCKKYCTKIKTQYYLVLRLIFVVVLFEVTLKVHKAIHN